MGTVAKKIMMGSGAVALPSDDQFNRVSFLSHFEGSNNGVNNSFDDGSASNHTITANGNVTQGSFGPFARPDGKWGVSFDGDDYLSVAETGADEFTFGTGDFTIEGWINNQAVDASQSRTIISTAQGNDFQGIWFGINGGKYYYIYNNSGGWSVIVDAGTPVANAWTHFALVRNGTSNVVYINGSSIGSTTETARDLTNTNNLLAIGGRATSSQYTISTMSNVRVVKGTAVYTGNFTPSTSKLTAITNTKLLTCQSNRFVDNSASPLTITPVGNPAVTAFGPFLTSSVYDPAVNGGSSIGGYVAAATSTDWQFGSGNFTVEFWTYPLGTGNWVIAHGDGSIAGTSISWQYGHGTFDFYYGSSYVQITSPTLTLNTWQHIAVVRNGATITVYKDGTSTGTANIGSNTLNTGGTTPFYVGNYPDAGSGYINGYLSDVRVVKGTAVYTSAFTPPTAPLTAITNTKLLLNMADGQAIDSTAQSNMSLVGTAKTSTAQYKFGTASLLLDGDSDLVTLPADVGRLSVSNAPIDFTIELAFRLAANVGGTPNSIIARWETSGDQRSWMVRMDNVSSENKMKFFDSSTGSNNASTTFSTVFSSETWYQIALVSVSGAVKLYVNGTADSTTHTWTTGVFNAPYDSTALLSIGANVPSSPDNFFNGNIDEVRLSKFARYTSNFTAPTEPFADKGQ